MILLQVEPNKSLLQTANYSGLWKARPPQFSAVEADVMFSKSSPDMNEEERLKVRDLQTGELYANIGEFVVKFEHLCHAMQTSITFLMHGQDLKNQQVANILLAGYTADHLRTLFESLIGELVKINDNEKKIVKNIFSRIQKLTERRNDVVHSTWYIGWGNEQTQDFSEAPGHKLHKNKQGAALKAFNYKAEDFLELVEEAEKLSSLVMRLHGCVTGEFSIEKNFKINETGNVIDKNEQQ